MTIINVVIPSSILSVEPGLLFKTIRVHQVIRFCSIFRVNKMVVYRDPFTKLDEHYEYVMLFSKIDKYLKTPPYLRKKLVPIDRDLRYVGVLPPLRLHIYGVSKEGEIGEKRLGYFIKDSYVDIGLNQYFKVLNPSECRFSNELVSVEIVSLKPPLVKCLSNDTYRGPVLEYSDSFSSAVEVSRKESKLLIATSRKGIVPSIDTIRSLASYENISVFFGAPRYGLYEIAEREGIVLEEVFNYIWNTIPEQGVKTVRTEEALISTLSILNILLKS